MKKNFYILLAILGINQILSFKPRRGGGGFNVALNDKDYELLLADVAGFGDSVTLNDIQTLPEKSQTNVPLEECYFNYKTSYENEIRIFNQKIMDFGSYLNSNLEIYYLKQVNAARQQLCNIANNLKVFPEELYKAIKIFSRAVKKIRNKSFEIDKYIKAFYVALLGIHKSREKKASEFHNKFKEIADDMKAKCQTVFQKIKNCMEGKD